MGLRALPTRVVGTGGPVTVVAHGLGGSIAETRPLVGGVAGTRVLYASRGHGDSPLGAEPLSYDVLAGDLAGVADAHAADRVFGVSMGAATALVLLAREPDRFRRAVLFLPPGRTGATGKGPATDADRRLAGLAAALEARDVGAVRASVAADLPAELADHTAAYVRARSDYLLASPGLPTVLRSLVTPAPDLSAVSAQVLVIGQEGDPLHPAQAARDLAAALPRAQLTVFDAPGAVFRERRRLRALVVDFLAG